MRIDEQRLEEIVSDRWCFYEAKIPEYVGRLQTIDIDMERVHQYNFYRIDCDFMMQNKSIHTAFHINEYGSIIDTDCSCPEGKHHKGCAHLIKAVQAINELQLNFQYLPIHIDYQKMMEKVYKERQRKQFEKYLNVSTESANQLVQKIQNESVNDIMEKEEKLVSLTFQIQAGYGGYPSFTAKIGQSRLYAVKNMSTLVKQVLNKETVKYGKNTYIPMYYDHFTEQSQKNFDFLSHYALAEEWKKTGYLDERSIDDFYHLYKPSLIPEIKKQMSIDIQVAADHVKVKLQDFDGFLLYGKKEVYFFDYDEYLYHLQCQKQSASLLRILDERKQLLIRLDSFKVFYQEVIRPIQSDIDIHTNTDLSKYDVIIKDIKLYADLENGQVRIWGKYTQNEIPRDMFRKGSIRPVSIIEALIARYADTVDDHVAIFKTKNQKLYDFLDEGIPKIQEVADVYVSNELKALKQRRSLQMNVSMKVKNNLLEIDLQSENVNKEELMSILHAYRRKKSFYKLKNGEMLNLQDDALKKLDTLASQYQLTKEDFMADEIQRPAYQALREQESIDIRKDASINAYMKKLDVLQASPNIEIGDVYQKLLRPYQLEGVRWMKQLHDLGLNGILADDMGLGKTLQVLCLLDCFISKESRSLIVCPSSLMFNWASEIDKFNIPMNYVCVNGNQKQREALIQEKHQLYITTYDYIKRDINAYKNISFAYAILDEAQFIKNPKTKNAQSVKQIKADHKLCLTGTPIENSLSELWSIFDFLLPGYLYSLPYFQKEYERPIVKDHDEEAQKKLKQMVSPFILRRTKNEVLDDLPEKEERTLWLDFEEEERKLYLANLAQVNLELQEQLKMDKVDSIVVLAMMTKLRQICCEPRMIYDNIKKPSTKLTMCVDLIETLKENHRKVLLFSSFTSIFDYMIDEFHKKRIQYHLLTGQTSKEKRKEEVEAFQNDDSDVFLISLKAGGTGLNLTKATAVIHFDPWWNISAQNQATDRAYRIGQTKNVLVYQLLMKNTIEAKIYDMQQRKKAMSDIFVENSNTSISQMSAEELKDLFSMK